MRRLLLLYLAALAVNWPDLPFNARLADLILVPMAIAQGLSRTVAIGLALTGLVRGLASGRR